MRFQKKIFLSIFVTNALLLIALALSVEELLRDAVNSQYLQHYGSMAKVIGDTLRQMEVATAKISSSSATVLSNLTRGSKVPSEEELRKIRSSLGVSQMVVTDKQGKILRDTETPVEQRTLTLFDFCAGYRKLLDDAGRIETTPILPSFPSGQAYIFSMMANQERTGVVEAGIHVSFIVDTLAKALVSDRNIRSIGLYTPKGVPLGYMAEDKPSSGPVPGLQPSELTLGSHLIGSDRLAIVSQVPASATTCCECEQKKLTRDDGQYYYILRTEVSLAPLAASIRELRLRTLMIASLALLLAFVLSHWFSALLVRRLHLFSEGIRKVLALGDLSQRVRLAGQDEITDLATTFNEMASKLEDTQKRAIEAEKNRALAAVAKQVAHDIRSPLAALRAASHSFPNDPESNQKLIRTASVRIHEIAENLLARYRESTSASLGGAPQESLLQMVEGAVEEKRAELGSGSLIALETEYGEGAYGLFSTLASSELRRVLSNLLNNAAEAMEGSGRVTLSLSAAAGLARLTVTDNGKGIPSELLPRLMQKGITHGKPTGSGLGLAHARETVQGAGGRISLASEEGKGTRITIELPTVAAPKWFLQEIVLDPDHVVVILDDDASIHRTWKSRLEAASGGALRILHCFGTDELGKQREALLEEKVPDSRQLYLVDYDLRRAEETGLDAIEKLHIAAFSVLVTSHTDDPLVRDRCLKLGIPLLAKGLMGEVPIRFSK